VQITGDRGDLVERVRQDYLTEEGSVGTAERAVLLQMTSGFERVIWMTHRFARLLEQRTTKVEGRIALAENPSRSEESTASV